MVSIIRISLSGGIFPSSSKIAKVVPLHKSGNKTNVNNYRPISVLPVLSKVFGRVVFVRISSLMDKCKHSYDEQFGFRPKFNTILAIIESTEAIKFSRKKSHAFC